jgi:uncharacterized protein (TIGR00645 family)
VANVAAADHQALNFYQGIENGKSSLRRVALAGVSLFVTTGHFDKTDMKKPDWLDHVNTYNLKLKLAFAIISISGVHALKTYLSGDLSLESIQIVTMVAVIHFTFVLSAIGISFAERLTRENH